MAEIDTLEKVVLRLSCQLLFTERDRDRWIAAATQREQQHELCKQALATTTREDRQKQEHIESLQNRLNLAEAQIKKMDFKLRSICLSAITAKANLRTEGKESGFVDATLKALREAAGARSEDLLPLHDWAKCESVPPSTKFSEYWDDTSSESEHDGGIESV